MPEGPIPETTKTAKKTSDSEGLSQAYRADSGFYRDPAGTLHVSGTRGGFLGQTGQRTTKRMDLD